MNDVKPGSIETALSRLHAVEREHDAAHTQLDLYDVPRESMKGRPLTLQQRIEWLFANVANLDDAVAKAVSRRQW